MPVSKKKKRRKNSRKKDPRATLATVLTLLLIGGFLFVCTKLFSKGTEKKTPVPNADTLSEADFEWKDGRAEYVGGAFRTAAGLDVSNHQGEVDWKKVSEQGFEFAFLRIGYRGYGSGKMEPDSSFTRNYEGAKAANIPVGIYFYSQATTDDEAKAEAEKVLELLGDRTLELPVIFDWERPAVDGARTQNTTNAQIASACKVFCAALEEAGYTTGIYLNRNKLEIISQYGLPRNAMVWVAQYSAAPTTQVPFTIWQYTNTGRIDGIAGDVDLDIMFLPLQEEENAQ